jgi:hypothetical protein
MGKFQDSISSAVAERLLNFVPGSANNVFQWRVVKKEDIAFTGATGNSHGDKDGTDAAHTLFKVDGDCAVLGVFGIINVDLTGASGTVEVGVVGNTAKLLAQTTATTLDAHDVWTDAGSEASVDIMPAGGFFVIADGADIIETVATTDIAAGQIDYYCIWAPLEAGASITAA